MADAVVGCADAANEEKPRYLPISEHGLIGDLRTVALVGGDGRLDWFCCPRFDSPSVFASILDADDGGHWTISPTGPVLSSRQYYMPDSNVLITRFHTSGGVVELQDFFPLLHPHDAAHRTRVVRRVMAVRGRTALRMDMAPRFDYGRQPHTVEAEADGVRLVTPELALRLRTDVAVARHDNDLRCDFSVDAGEQTSFVLEVLGADDDGAQAPPGTEELMSATVAFWQAWISRSAYTGRWREMVHRSALTLKLLTHEPTGAIVAAATASLPEEIGGSRNWDYRYVWIRDAAFSLYGLLRMGFTDEADAFMGWLAGRFAAGDETAAGPLRPFYDIDGRPAPPEVVLDHWEGYEASGPVRIGNHARDQLQLDIYGELIDSVYLYNKHGPGISYDSWQNLQQVVAWLQENWDQPDEGIWEVRAGRRHHVYSKLMCWVAMERMVRIARQRGLPGDLGDWARTRDEIFEQIMTRGWDPQRATFVQSYGNDSLDASLLLMSAVKFLAPTDDRFTSTLDAIQGALVTDSLVFRYDTDTDTDTGAGTDGLTGAEGTFSMCSFWYVEALTRAGRLAEARLALEKMFTYANHLGLYAEEIGLSGDQLGNFPQAFTHLSLISAAINLDRVLN